MSSCNIVAYQGPLWVRDEGGRSLAESPWGPGMRFYRELRCICQIPCISTVSAPQHYNQRQMSTQGPGCRLQDFRGLQGISWDPGGARRVYEAGKGCRGTSRGQTLQVRGPQTLVYVTPNNAMLWQHHQLLLHHISALPAADILILILIIYIQSVCHRFLCLFCLV